LYSVFAGGAVGNLNGFGAQARFRGPQGVIVDRFGNVYVADSGNNSIRKINSSGNVSVLAGTASGFTPISGSKDGLGKKASFSNPTGLFLDSLGQLYVADRGNGLIRVVN
jgi:DNA-binding beta-propeller fold protein YncE